MLQYLLCSHFVLNSEERRVSHPENHTGQNVLPMVGDDLRRVRLQLGMTQAELGEALRLGEPTTAERTVRRWELAKDKPVSGPVSLALEMLAARAIRDQLHSGERRMNYDRIPLADGEAEHMGDGVFVVFQDVEGSVQTIVLTPKDLEVMIAENKKGTLSAS